MWFGHMRHTAPFLCNADKKGEGESERNGEETPVTNRKWHHQLSHQSDFRRAEQRHDDGGAACGHVWMRILGEERRVIIISGIMMLSTWLMGRFSRSIQSWLIRAVTVMKPYWRTFNLHGKMQVDQRSWGVLRVRSTFHPFTSWCGFTVHPHVQQPDQLTLISSTGTHHLNSSSCPAVKLHWVYCCPK